MKTLVAVTRVELLLFLHLNSYSNRWARLDWQRVKVLLVSTSASVTPDWESIGKHTAPATTAVHSEMTLCVLKIYRAPHIPSLWQCCQTSPSKVTWNSYNYWHRESEGELSSVQFGRHLCPRGCTLSCLKKNKNSRIGILLLSLSPGGGDLLFACCSINTSAKFRKSFHVSEHTKYVITKGTKSSLRNIV